MSAQDSDGYSPRILAILNRGPAASVIQRALGDEGFAVEMRDAQAAAAVWRDAHSFDAVLLDDAGLEPDQAREAVERGWIRNAAPLFVVAERLPGRDRYMAWLEAGAWDVLKIPLESTALGLRLRNVLARGRVERAHSTRLYDFRTLERVADEALALARRYRRELHCAGVAVDWPGSEARDGDSIVIRLADVAQRLVRSSDLLGIGEERVLLVLLPDTDEAGSAIFLDRLVSTLETRLREWEVLAPLRGLFLGPEDGDSGRDLLGRLVSRLASTPR